MNKAILQAIFTLSKKENPFECTNWGTAADNTLNQSICTDSKKSISFNASSNCW